MGTYRVEYAKRGQAVCQGPPCKKESVKIGKGELRFGTWVDIGGKFASWKWRHLGCVTSKVLKNMKKEYGNVKDELDGYEDLTTDDADKIVKAIENETLEIDDMTPALRPTPKSESADEEGNGKETPAKKRKRKTSVQKDDDATSEVSDGDVKPKTAPSSKKAPRKTPVKKPKKRASSESEEEEEEEEEIISELSSEESAVETEEEEDERPAKKRATSKSTAAKKAEAKKTTGRAKPPARNAKSKSKAIVESDVQSEDDSE